MSYVIGLPALTVAMAVNESGNATASNQQKTVLVKNNTWMGVVNLAVMYTISGHVHKCNMDVIVCTREFIFYNIV